MYTRSLQLPAQSFFLLGPRGTGKSTWVRQQVPQALEIDLLRTHEFLRLQQDPGLLRSRVLGAEPGSWIFIDEIQKLPELLDEVHSLLSLPNASYRFVLTGSSARKLKRAGANLLAGRALTRKMSPLLWDECGGDYDLDRQLALGCLPRIVATRQSPEAWDLLEAYVATYLQEEIQQEAAVKNLSSFSRFLTVAALMHGQRVNVASMARDCGVARPTVQGYFQVLTDTLLGSLLPAWQGKVRVKEVGHPKFYYFDNGVVRTLLNRHRDVPSDSERGTLFEGHVLHQLRGFTETRQLAGEWHYWASAAGQEIDFVWVRGKRAVGFEVKASTRWRSEYSDSLKLAVLEGKLESAWGVYLGQEVLQDGPVRILPVGDFLKLLCEGKILAEKSGV